MVGDVARLGTTRYGDDGPPSIPSCFRVSLTLYLSTAAVIERGRPLVG